MSNFTPLDYQFMVRALELAKRGIYTTAPNPNVGCVIARDGEIVGEGFHLKAGEPHAEVHALRMAGEKAVGATAYVTLEPCSHYGRTPPCAEGLIKAKVAKVICAMQDPNPQVSGRGIQMLRDAGIDVEVGLLEVDAKALNPAFIKKMQTGMPFVQLKMAASLDGQTALNNGKSQWITSPHARQDVQTFRAMSGAILSTSKTVIDDNASLNVRWDDLPCSVQSRYGLKPSALLKPSDEVNSQEQKSAVRQPIRVILDRQHRLTEDLNLFQTQGEVLRVGSEGADINLTETDHQLDLAELMSQLAEQHNINHVWVEAGATLAGQLLKNGLVDELIVYLAPKLMGSDGRGLIGALGLECMSQVIELDIQDVRQVGQDIRLIAKPVLKENK
ncbi:bifunctional diaminohydroxyphosphoribosylaminopyrimidine deaminase/5-amino-6-(5-phosphoribosylamino)uracil reductase RibD [Vibrio genomosp. F6]|uniref:Riboflavin biosynthesis protein RibD n=1 Tax=Vibrio genomosp. F6 str. FF-238 TaxID=1191298 RepID=A0A1E5CLR6_9VIBR|nr:bifunctional diaminohydroxyphosphoribosylaminopyrimidine deaminase/5-amino-6-(5-phosphoribosylamino)uracil reductase RibD [Vibrio genomosp. F6]OEE69627.1 riboflavin biosynthesis protein RibD [Vibrio genomosp. F6 str. FF-238]